MARIMTRQLKARAEHTAYDQCLSVNPDNPLAVAESIRGAFEALSKVNKAYDLAREAIDLYDAMELVSAILATARTKE